MPGHPGSPQPGFRKGYENILPRDWIHCHPRSSGLLFSGRETNTITVSAGHSKNPKGLTLLIRWPKFVGGGRLRKVHNVDHGSANANPEVAPLPHSICQRLTGVVHSLKCISLKDRLSEKQPNKKNIASSKRPFAARTKKKTCGVWQLATGHKPSPRAPEPQSPRVWVFHGQVGKCSGSWKGSSGALLLPTNFF